MRRQAICSATTQAGDSCQGFAVSSRGFCVSHDPDYQARKREGSRRGGEAKANARRAAREWTESGKQIRPHELPDLLRGCILRVASGQMEPGQASAIAALARTSVQLSEALEMEQRLAALEVKVGTNQGSGIRRVK